MLGLSLELLAARHVQRVSSCFFIMPYTDSIDKIVSSYFAVVTRQRFTYKSVVYTPKPLRVSELIFRGYTCPAKCGGCCPRFSLDYLPHEQLPLDRSRIAPRFVDFNLRRVLVLSDLQSDHRSHFCRNLKLDDGRCGVHGTQPFSCDFELIRSSLTSDASTPNGLTTRLFGRGWNMLRVDGERGARCGMLEATSESTADVVRKLKRLQQWAQYFQLATCLDRVIEWASRGPHDEPATFNT